MKILNLYAGIGGNRKLWGGDHEITAVEIDKNIAAIYKDFYPNDNVIISDAHQYLLDNYEDYDFIWSSPPCPTHSRFNFLNIVQNREIKYPDMKLYEEIIILKTFFTGKYCVENVISYYDPLLNPIESNSHYYWTNFYFPRKLNETRHIRANDPQNKKLQEKFDIDLSKYNLTNRFKRMIINNCVHPEDGLYIFNRAFDIIENEKNHKQIGLFN